MAEQPFVPSGRIPRDQPRGEDVVQTPVSGTPAPIDHRPSERDRPGLLDRSIDLAGISPYAIAWTVIIAVGALLRLIHLDRFALSPSEARLAFDGWNLLSGAPLDPGQSLPETQPLVVILQAVSFFLFGTDDVAARLASAAAGLGLLGLVGLLRPVVGRRATLGMAALLAISPTAVYTSRLVDSNILIVFSALLLVVATCRAGVAVERGTPVARWAVTFGVGLALLLASGPASISVLLAVLVGLVVSIALDPTRTDPRAAGARSVADAGSNALLAGTRALTGQPGALTVLVASFAVAALALFSRLGTDLSALAGLGVVFADWGRLIGSGAPAIPTQYYLLVILLYEIVALVFAVVAATMPQRPSDTARADGRSGLSLNWAFFLGWFAATLVIFAFSSGRQATDAIQIVLPLVLMAGIGLGTLFRTIDWGAFTRGSGYLLVVAAIGIVAGLVATAVLISDSDTDTGGTGTALLQILLVLVVVVGGMVYLSVTVAARLRRQGRPIQYGRMALLAALLLLGLFTVRSTTELNSWNIASGTELLAQQTPTQAVPALIDRLAVLSRDQSVTRSSIADPLGQHSLNVLVDPEVEWPFRWYLRDSTSLTIGTPDRATEVGAEVVIGPEGSMVSGAGYTPQTYTYLNRVPAAYDQPSFGDVLTDVFVPSRWDTGSQYLFFRTLAEPALPSTLVVNYDSALSGRLFQTSEPTNLYAQTGFGSGDGQLDEPRGIGLSSDGETIYVVDSLNARVELFSPDGTFLSAWGGSTSASDLQLGLFQPSDTTVFGASDLVVGPNDLVYVADTWNHVVTIVSPDGLVIRDIGVPGEPVDLGDDPAAVADQPGVFFGPRAVAVTDAEIFVTDTGNERIQVFGLDGTFLRAFGGFGTEPGQLVEPVGVAVDDSGTVYVADSGNARISLYSTDGASIGEWPVPEWDAYRYDPATGARPNFEPYVYAAPDGLVYVTSRVTSSILVFDPAGNRVGDVTAVEGVGLVAPVGMTVSPEGDLYVTDVEANAVYRQPLADLGLNAPNSGDVGAGASPEAPATPDASAAARDTEPEAVIELPNAATPPATPDLATPIAEVIQPTPTPQG